MLSGKQAWTLLLSIERDQSLEIYVLSPYKHSHMTKSLTRVALAAFTAETVRPTVWTTWIVVFSGLPFSGPLAAVSGAIPERLGL